MELIIPLLVILFLAGSISFLRPSKKMKFLAELRLSAMKLGFKIDSSNAMKGIFKNDQSDLVSYQLRNTTIIKKGQFVREGDAMNLYDPASLKFDQNFQNIEEKINQLPQSVLEIIFFESNIAILWDEKLGIEELKKIHRSINKF
jgi:hypothetical protein